MELVEQYGLPLLRLARSYVSSRAVAEEVVQEALLGVLSGIDGFEARSSLKTWVLRILTNRAKTRGVREARSIPFSALGDLNAPTVDPERLLDGCQRRAGHWARPPRALDAAPEERLLADETRELVDETIATLSAAQRAVITLRDVEGWNAAEVCALLELSEANQRVLLHRARARVRGRLELYLSGV